MVCEVVDVCATLMVDVYRLQGREAEVEVSLTVRAEPHVPFGILPYPGVHGCQNVAFLDKPRANSSKISNTTLTSITNNCPLKFGLRLIN